MSLLTRLATIKKPDKILVLKDGQIIEQGNHESLLADRGFYHDLYMSQFSNKKEALDIYKKETQLELPLIYNT